MTPEEAHNRGARLLDEATENLTFDAFHWAFEEAWRGVAWMLSAHTPKPGTGLPVSPRDALAGLDAVRSSLNHAPDLSKAQAWTARFEALHDQLAQATAQPNITLADAAARAADDIVDLVFDAWQLHDALLPFVNSPQPSPARLTIPRRTALKWLAAASVVPLAACERIAHDPKHRAAPATTAPALMTSEPAPISAIEPLTAMQWPTEDPFLFCAYHVDDYPAGNSRMAPDATLAGRDLGRDFDPSRAWRMYHGRTVPGFPRHPHRGFETVTVVRTGLLDHADSMGAAARYGAGDVQWLTAGGGIQHAEMFPLVASDAPNPLEFFQIWLNLPRADKMVDSYFTMLWSESIPRVIQTDSHGRIAEIIVHAGAFRGESPPPPPPNSWASRPDSDVAIWSITLEPSAQLSLPRVSAGTRRSLYVHRGAGLRVGSTAIHQRSRVRFTDPGPLHLTNGPTQTELLLLQGRPIDEPIAKRGPFVMNTRDEIRQAYADYRRTQFGGWPWDAHGPVHPRARGRFARHIDGRLEEPA